MLITRRFLGVCLMTANAYLLAEQLARPVARGYLTLNEAKATLLAAALRAYREGSPYEPEPVYQMLLHIFGQHLEKEQTRRGMTEMRVARRLKPLIALRKPRNVLLAEAHDVNGTEGFPLTEDEVADVAATEVYRASSGRRLNHVR